MILPKRWAMLVEPVGEENLKVRWQVAPPSETTERWSTKLPPPPPPPTDPNLHRGYELQVWDEHGRVIASCSNA